MGTPQTQLVTVFIIDRAVVREKIDKVKFVQHKLAICRKTVAYLVFRGKTEQRFIGVVGRVVNRLHENERIDIVEVEGPFLAVIIGKKSGDIFEKADRDAVAHIPVEVMKNAEFTA